MAIAALVLSVIGMWPVSIVLAFIALSRTKKSRDKGRSMAAIALFLSLIWLSLTIYAVEELASWAKNSGALSPSAALPRDGNGQVKTTGDQDIENVKAGDCFVSWPEDGSMTKLKATPCTKPHLAQVYAIGALPAGAFPGNAAAQSQAEKLCTAKMPADVPPGVADRLSEAYTYPTGIQWAVGDRQVICAAVVTGAPMTAPLK